MNVLIIFSLLLHVSNFYNFNMLKAEVINYIENVHHILLTLKSELRKNTCNILPYLYPSKGTKRI